MDSIRISFPRLNEVATPARSAKTDQIAELSAAVKLVEAAEGISCDRNRNKLCRDGATDGVKAPKRISVKSPDTDVYPTDFEVLGDGSLLELVTDHQTRREVQFLHWSDSGFQFAERVKCGGKIFTPPALHPSLIRVVQLPTGTRPSGDSRHMFDRIADLLKEFLDLPERTLALIATFILSTWFPEFLTTAPILWITGPPMSGKTTLLTLLNCLCRRPILLTDVTPAAFYALRDALRPTLLVDESELSNSTSDRRIMSLIRAGSTRGVHVVRHQRIFDCFGPIAIAARLRPQDEALASRAVFVTMLPARRSLRPFNPELLRDRIDDLQSQLLNLRLANYHQVREPELPGASDLNPRMLQIARALATPLLNDKSLEEQLIDSLREQEQEADCVRCDQPEYVVAEALFNLSHKQPAGEVGVQNIANEVNRLLVERGDDGSFKPRRVGEILRGSLGIRTERLGSWGRGVRISHQYLRQVHELAQRFGITRRDTGNWLAVKAGYGGEPCELCTEFDLGAGLRFVGIKPRKRTTPRLFQQRDERLDEREQAQNAVSHSGAEIGSEQSR
jgi:hypothetical protein